MRACFEHNFFVEQVWCISADRCRTHVPGSEILVTKVVFIEHKNKEPHRMNYRFVAAILGACMFFGCALGLATQNGCASMDRVRIQLQWVLQAQFAGKI